MLSEVCFVPKADIGFATLFGIKASPNCDLDYLVHGLAQFSSICIAPPGGVLATDLLLLGRYWPPGQKRQRMRGRTNTMPYMSRIVLQLPDDFQWEAHPRWKA